MFIYRFLIVSLPAFVLVMGYGLSRLRSTWTLTLALVLLLLLTALDLRSYETTLAKEDWRGVTADLLAQAAPQDGILFDVAPGYHAFEYYAQLDGRSDALANVIYPARDDWNAESPDPSLLHEIAVSHPRIWLIETHLSSPAYQRANLQLHATLAAQYSVQSEQKFRGVDLLLYTNPLRH
jgi:hypothetical protein